ncbi:MAG: hypothetical protein HOP16_20635 [Acidobacteria bacterium]|nr:hypothetical protein [Acidobacteriota bacterium]
MTWKSYAAASGATVLAGWLASAPPENAANGAAVVRARPARATVSTASASDIQEQASRLQSRIRRETSYVRPARNPFRFSESGPVASAIPAPEPSNVPVQVATPFVPPPPTVTLVGMAEDRAEQGSERTAILSSPEGVLLVRKGDDVLGQYRVTAVDEEAVELTSVADGSTLRLSLAR